MEPASDLTLEGLTSRIAQSSKTISDCISQQSLQPLSFTTNGPSTFPIPPTFSEAHAARLALIEATDLLRKLALGPKECVDWLAFAHNDTSNLRTLLRLHVFENIPIDSSITYTDLASKIGGQDVFRLQRVIHYAILNGLFFEPQPGHVAHSSLSATIVNDAGHTALIRHCVEEVYPSSSREADWMLQHPVNDGEPTETGFRLAFGTEKKFFEYIYEEPDRRQNFAMAMTSLTAPGAILDGANVLRLFDWAKLGRATIVDVGGGRGHVCAALAASHPQLSFVVQDIASVVEYGKDAVPAELHPRFEFLAQDFFKPQPDLRSRGKVVYYLRFIMHDWSNKYCVKILRNIIDVMEEGGTILINDQVLPESGGVNRHLEKLARNTDMHMRVLHNGQERSVADVEKLLAETDPRLKLIGVHSAPGSPLSIVEVQLSGQMNGH